MFVSKKALPCTADLVTSEGMLSLGGVLECEPPNIHLYNFVGTFTLSSEPRLTDDIVGSTEISVPFW